MKISYSLRAFGLYFLILGTLIWFTLDNAVERLNDGMRQSAESVLVDTANILASFVEDEIGSLESSTAIDVTQLERVFNTLDQRPLSAQIYQVTKESVDSQVYITDQNGKVIYDSSGQHTGEDYSKWRDVQLTLAGEYGARTSYISQQHTEPDDPKVMVIAAPIRFNNEIIGVLSVQKPIDSLEGHLLIETKQLQQYAFALLLLALVLGYLLSLWFTHSLNRIAGYANDMAEGKNVQAPVLQDSRLAALTDSISYMRSQIDGKEYVENYIHGLTHELKTPITSIRGAVELLTEEMPASDRQLFINNINTSNQRMSRLVERMLSLAKLEGLGQLVATSKFDLLPTLKRLIQE
ncbi:MAG: two-component system sensor histidine kinase CreC, partial [Gammaproteobacteria bacterium]|nr:two-component system sensor histidine kinase CreC [Gammaproteobacteria bacterium]